MLRYYCFLSLFCLLTPSCKHSHEPSENLKEAISIHLEAEKIGKSVDSLIQELLQAGIPVDDFIKKFETWKQNGVGIEGMDHSHHDHSHHDHSHAHHPPHHMSDEDMILVQKEWKDSIAQLKLVLQNVLEK
ncbi:MAG TPA: hypothetical protein PKC30_02270 [Saprospiraceae bacterium]|nr:hypothetical protein [Saprospiraceae bacterium]